MDGILGSLQTYGVFSTPVSGGRHSDLTKTFPIQGRASHLPLFVTVVESWRPERAVTCYPTLVVRMIIKKASKVLGKLNSKER